MADSKLHERALVARSFFGVLTRVGLAGGSRCSRDAFSLFDVDAARLQLDLCFLDIADTSAEIQPTTTMLGFAIDNLVVTPRAFSLGWKLVVVLDQGHADKARVGRQPPNMQVVCVAMAVFRRTTEGHPGHRHVVAHPDIALSRSAARTTPLARNPCSNSHSSASNPPGLARPWARLRRAVKRQRSPAVMGGAS